MHYTGPVYRPPPEADTPLLEITYGCSWEKCSFCQHSTIRVGVSDSAGIAVGGTR